jgi:hypothetical protein
VEEVPDEQGAIPDDKPDEMKSGLMCFIKEDRECGASCMAFLPQPADVQLLSLQQRHCVVIVSAERLARHAVIGVKLLSDAYQDFKKTSADRARANQKPPETPR